MKHTINVSVNWFVNPFCAYSHFPHSLGSAKGGARARWATQMNIRVWPPWAMEIDFNTMQEIENWFISFVLDDFWSRFELPIANKIISL